MPTTLELLNLLIDSNMERNVIFSDLGNLGFTLIRLLKNPQDNEKEKPLPPEREGW